MARKVIHKKLTFDQGNVDPVHQKGFLKKTLILMYVKENENSEILNKTENPIKRNLQVLKEVAIIF